MKNALRSFARGFAQPFNAAAAVLDARDGLLGLGLVLLTVGLWPHLQETALVAPGTVLTYVAIFGVRG